MKKFQTTQYLKPDPRKKIRSKEDNEEEDSPSPLPIRETEQNFTNSSKITDLDFKEQRRQVNLMQSTAHVTQKKENLVKKLLEGNLQVNRAKILKEGRKSMTPEDKKRKHQQQAYKEADHDRVINQIKLHEMYKAQSIAMKRDQKNEWAKVQVQHLKEIKQKKAAESRQKWEEKRAQVNNVKDLAEFKRGLMMADLNLQDDRFKMWK
jgi:hypothetical protein